MSNSAGEVIYYIFKKLISNLCIKKHFKELLNVRHKHLQYFEALLESCTTLWRSVVTMFSTYSSLESNHRMHNPAE